MLKRQQASNQNKKVSKRRGTYGATYTAEDLRHAMIA
jgi:hypothetical protein